MGLDVYVGTFHRYYSGQWETIVQQAARQTGMTVQIVRPNQTGLLPRIRSWFRSTRNLEADIEKWRRSLTGPAAVELRWNEGTDTEYFTDKPAWDCYGALLLWAAYNEHRAPNHPATAEGWSENPLLAASVANPNSRYRHLLSNSEVWLPGEFEPFNARSLLGENIVVASSNKLARELTDLNESTWKATASEISSWRLEGAEYGAALEQSARFGFAVFFELTEAAVQNKLPMKLDY
jgi:hypothetical protein